MIINKKTDGYNVKTDQEQLARILLRNLQFIFIMGEEYLSSLPVLDSSLITTIAFVAVLVSLIITIFIIIGETGKLYSTRSKPLNLPPGSYGWPILGETLEFLGAGVDGIPEKYIKERMEKYQSTEVFKTSLMGEPVAVLCSPAGNKFLFSNENKLVTIWWPNSVRKLLGPCLATTSGDEGKQMRKMLSCFITPDAFTRLYIKTMDVVAQQHINTHWLGMTIAQTNVYSTIDISNSCVF